MFVHYSIAMQFSGVHCCFHKYQKSISLCSILLFSIYTEQIRSELECCKDRKCREKNAEDSISEIVFFLLVLQRLHIVMAMLSETYICAETFK